MRGGTSTFTVASEPTFTSVSRTCSGLPPTVPPESNSPNRKAPRHVGGLFCGGPTPRPAGWPSRRPPVRITSTISHERPAPRPPPLDPDQAHHPVPRRGPRAGRKGDHLRRAARRGRPGGGRPPLRGPGG